MPLVGTAEREAARVVLEHDGVPIELVGRVDEVHTAEEMFLHPRPNLDGSHAFTTDSLADPGTSRAAIGCSALPRPPVGPHQHVHTVTYRRLREQPVDQRLIGVLVFRARGDPEQHSPD